MSSPWQSPDRRDIDRRDAPAPTPPTWPGNDRAPDNGRSDPMPADDDGEQERFHPAYMLISMVRSIRGFIIPIGIAIFSGSRGDLVWLLIAVAFAGLTVVSAVANWWMSSYQITGRSLRLRTGWLNRQERAVAFERIQSIDIQEPPLARLLGVAQLRVETAAGGGANADIVIEAIARDEATALRNQLLAERAHRSQHESAATANGRTPDPNGPQPAEISSGELAPVTAGAQDASGGTLIRALSGRDLLLAGLTSSRIGPAAAILAAVSQFGDDLIGSRVESVVESTTFNLTQVVIGLIVIGGLVAWALSILGTVITFSGFSLRREDDNLVVSSGLLERRRTTIPLHRIQSVTVKEGLLRQPFGLASVHFVSAGYGGGQQNNDSGVLFPLIRRADVAILLGQAVPAFATNVEAVRSRGQRLPERALSRYLTLPIFWDVAFLAGAIIACSFIPFTEWWYGFAVILLASWPWSLLSYRDTRWMWDDEDRLIVQGRSIARSVTIIPRRRVQFREVGQNWFQRRANLASIGVRVAGSTFGNSVTIAHLDAGDATELAGRLGFHDIPRRRRIRRPAAAAPAPEPGAALTGD